MTNELLLYLSMVILPASFAVVVYFINQPYKDKRKAKKVIQKTPKHIRHRENLIK